MSVLLSFEKRIEDGKDIMHLQPKDVVRFMAFGPMRYQGVINNLDVFIGRGIPQLNDEIIELWFEKGTLHSYANGQVSNEMGYCKRIYTQVDHHDAFHYHNEELREASL